ncbi:MAG: serine hydrolase [Chloroflexi bacterium]|nr:serine hydrolase [Chloroflexota bacterium]
MRKSILVLVVLAAATLACGEATELPSTVPVTEPSSAETTEEVPPTAPVATPASGVEATPAYPTLAPIVTPGAEGPTVPPPPGAGDVWDGVEAAVDASPLEQIVLMVGTDEGTVFVARKGIATEFIAVPIASSTKWLTAATVLRLVEQGEMSLDDNPQDYIDWWTGDPADPRSRITLGQLLSMTAGFWGEPLCVWADGDPDECARNVYNIWHIYDPGSTFFYSSSHMHIAGLIAAEATGLGFNDIFRLELADPLGMSIDAGYLYPSTNNPFMAGGASMNANDYMLFLEALYTGQILADSTDIMYQDWTADPVALAYSPVQSLTEWHYGLGTWRECPAETWLESCSELRIVSSGGGLGWFPWIDYENGYYALIGQVEGDLGESFLLAAAVRPMIIEALEALE